MGKIVSRVANLLRTGPGKEPNAADGFTSNGRVGAVYDAASQKKGVPQRPHGDAPRARAPGAQRHAADAVETRPQADPRRQPAADANAARAPRPPQGVAPPFARLPMAPPPLVTRGEAAARPPPVPRGEIMGATLGAMSATATPAVRFSETATAAWASVPLEAKEAFAFQLMNNPHNKHLDLPPQFQQLLFSHALGAGGRRPYFDANFSASLHQSLLIQGALPPVRGVKITDDDARSLAPALQAQIGAALARRGAFVELTGFGCNGIQDAKGNWIKDGHNVDILIDNPLPGSDHVRLTVCNRGETSKGKAIFESYMIPRDQVGGVVARLRFLADHSMSMDAAYDFLERRRGMASPPEDYPNTSMQRDSVCLRAGMFAALKLAAFRHDPRSVAPGGPFKQLKGDMLARLASEVPATAADFAQYKRVHNERKAAFASLDRALATLQQPGSVPATALPQLWDALNSVNRALSRETKPADLDMLLQKIGDRLATAKSSTPLQRQALEQIRAAYLKTRRELRAEHHQAWFGSNPEAMGKLVGSLTQDIAAMARRQPIVERLHRQLAGLPSAGGANTLLQQLSDSNRQLSSVDAATTQALCDLLASHVERFRLQPPLDLPREYPTQRAIDALKTYYQFLSLGKRTEAVAQWATLQAALKAVPALRFDGPALHAT